jgi:hypothetical protein
MVVIVFFVLACESVEEETYYTASFFIGDETELFTVEVKKDEKLSKPDNPTKEGYIFKYWYVNNEEDDFDFNTRIENDLELYAYWEENPIDYTYTYQLNMKNYEEHLSFSHNIIDTDDWETKIVEIEMKLLDEVAALDDVSITFRINFLSPITGNIVDKDVTHTFMMDEPLVFQEEYPSLNTFSSISIINIRGDIHTQTSHEIDYEESQRIKEELEDKLSYFNDEQELTQTMRIFVDNNGYQSLSVNTLKFRESPYYLSSVSEGQGIIIRDTEKGYEMIEFGVVEDIPYYRLLSRFDALDDAITTEVEILNIKDSYFYSYEDGKYVISADTEILFNDLFEEEVRDSLLEMYNDDLTHVYINIKENIITLEIKLESYSGYIEMKITYSFQSISEDDLSNSKEMPPFDPNMISYKTDVSTTQENQLFVSGHTNYYMVDLEDSLYALEIDSKYDINFYDLSFNQVNFSKSDNPLYETYDLYEVEAGTYIVGVSSSLNINGLYDFRLFPLNDYETLIDFDDPEEMTSPSYLLNIEGRYDYVLSSIISEKGGLLVLSADEPIDIIIHRFNHLNDVNKILFDTDQNQLLIQLNPGENKFLFSSFHEKTIDFDVNIQGVSWQEDMTLTENYQPDYITGLPGQAPVFSFDHEEDGYAVFDMMLNDLYDFSSNGFYAQIWKENTYGTSEIYTSFNIYSDQTKVYLKAGTYDLRILPILSYKIKYSYEMPNDMSDEVVSKQVVDDFESYVYSADEDDFDTFNHYPGTDKTLIFTIEEASYVYVHTNYSPSYILEDELGNILNKYEQNDVMTYLQPGTYYIKYKDHGYLNVRRVNVKVLIIEDEKVQADDSFIHQISQVNTNTSFEVKNDYRHDSDYYEFTITEDSTVTINVFRSLWFVIYQMDGSFIRSESGTSVDLTLEAGTYILKIGHSTLSSMLGETFNVTIQTSN